MKGQIVGGLLTFLRHNTIALIALFVAMGGTAYAAATLPPNSVGTKQLKRSAVTGAKVKNDTITGAKVLESSLGTVPLAANASTFGGISPSVFGTAATYAGVDFRPRESSTTYTYALSGSISRTSVGGYFSAPVDLPQGAAVTRLTIFFHNTVAGDAGSLILTRYDLAGGGMDIEHVSTTGTLDWHSESADLSPAAAVDNRAYAYVLVWIPPASANALAGARIDYTLP